MNKTLGLSAKQFLFVVITLLFLSSFVVMQAIELTTSREREIEFARRHSLNLSRVLEGQILGSVGKIDITLKEAVNDITPAMLDPHSNLNATNYILSRHLERIPESQSLRAVTERGNFRFDASGIISPINVGDRAYFLQQQNNPDAELVLSEPIFARLTHNWVFTLSRRITRPDGSFAGLVQAAINQEHFEKVLGNIDLDTGDLIGVYDLNARMIARLPSLPSQTGQTSHGISLQKFLQSGLREKSYEAVSPFDGIERIMSFRRVEGLPLVIIAGRAKSNILKEWNTKAVIYGFSTIGLVAAFLVLLSIWQRRYRDAEAMATMMSQSATEHASRLRALLDSIPDQAWIKDQYTRYTAVNQAFADIVGKHKDDILGKRACDIWPDDNIAQMNLSDQQLLQDGIAQSEEVSITLHTGEEKTIEFLRAPVLDEHGNIVGIAGVGRDISARKRNEERIRHMAEHDALTDLPNRTLLSRQLAAAVADNLGNTCPLALLFIDLDHFKNVNDSLGHEIGDHLLIEVATRLKATLSEHDIVSRQGGDEFVVLLTRNQSESLTARQIEGILTSFSTPFTIQGHELSITASIGVAMYPEDGTDLGTLLRHADTAMYSAKKAGRNHYRFFAAEMNDRVQERMELENYLRQALKRHEIELYFQPLVHAQHGHVVTLETLVRWKHPTLGMVSPARFIPVAEETGLIISIGEWILRRACEFGRKLHDSGHADLVIAVNLSTVQFRQSNLASVVANALLESGLPARYLELEITESVLIEDGDEVVDTCRRLKTLGVKLSMDDFGTGYSSLSYLRRFPFDTIKIDQSFVRDLLTDPDDAAIIEAIIAISAKLKLSVTAEGVETLEQANKLSEQGCHVLQGYHFSRPMPARQTQDWLREYQLETLDADTI